MGLQAPMAEVDQVWIVWAFTIALAPALVMADAQILALPPRSLSERLARASNRGRWSWSSWTISTALFLLVTSAAATATDISRVGAFTFDQVDGVVRGGEVSVRSRSHLSIAADELRLALCIGLDVHRDLTLKLLVPP